ncbi:beta-ketoacyl synthase N-terminal-like domain-containing protein [Muricauda sp. MAR_2010_75]|uniref:beta-ketoacyl synthase N-terminal-like domain-containing protein n=1 Tax=Allomuricauda sp. MAR_2010_75 TaxID=1250232 RepID=UPI0005676221|nr:beta-ketoacyl synthase N-terminal-like domain-containing protein [Muricauda sp. MAR_2010_75]
MKTKPLNVVVTSLGVSSPNGNSITSFAKNYSQKDIGCRRHIDDGNLEKDLSNFSTVNQRRMDRLTKITMMAAVDCLDKVQLSVDESNINDVGGIFCSSYGPIASARDFIHSGFKLGLNSASPLIFPYTVINSAPGAIAVLMKTRGFSTTVQGYNPIAYAFDVIRNKKAKAILAGGFDELSPELEKAYLNRTIVDENGTKKPSAIANVSEGSAMLFLEEEEFAIGRKSEILFKLCNYSVSSNLQYTEESIDNFGFISAECIYKTMTSALERSEIERSKISLIISLAREDSHQIESEKEALKKIWPEKIPEVYYPKPNLGETLGASDCFAMIVGYLRGLEIKHSKTSPIYVVVNSYHIGGNCFSMIIEV